MVASMADLHRRLCENVGRDARTGNIGRINVSPTRVFCASGLGRRIIGFQSIPFASSRSEHVRISRAALSCSFAVSRKWIKAMPRCCFLLVRYNYSEEDGRCSRLLRAAMSRAHVATDNKNLIVSSINYSSIISLLRIMSRRMEHRNEWSTRGEKLQPRWIPNFVLISIETGDHRRVNYAPRSIFVRF